MSDYSNTFNGAGKDASNATIYGVDFDTEFDAIASMSTTKANKVVTPTTGNVITQTSTGDLQDSGYSFPNLVGAANPNQSELNLLVGKAALLDPTSTTTTDYNHNIRQIKADPILYQINNSSTGNTSLRLYPSSTWWLGEIEADGVSDQLILRKRDTSNATTTVVTIDDTGMDVATGELEVAGNAVWHIQRPAPSDIFWYGDGSDGTFSSSASFSLVPGEHWYTDFTLNSGHTLSINGYGGIVIRATNSITISGTIDAKGRSAKVYHYNKADNASPERAPGQAGFGGGGGASTGDGTNIGYVGQGTMFTWGGAATSTNGGAGDSLQQPHLRAGYFNLPQLLVGGGHGAKTLSGGILGGSGGGAIILIAPTITINSTGILDARGNNGAVYSSVHSSGGGGGGVVLLVGKTITNAGTVYTNGGTGGAGSSYRGGNGGAGLYATVVL